MLDWRGDLLQDAARPQINAAQDQAILILPTRPGTYRLQLVARNARGVVAYSNELRVVAAVSPDQTTDVRAERSAIDDRRCEAYSGGHPETSDNETVNETEDKKNYLNTSHKQYVTIAAKV